MGGTRGAFGVRAQSVFRPLFSFVAKPICLVLLMVAGGALVVYAAVGAFLDACYGFQWVGPVRRAILSEDGVCTVIANNPPWLLLSGLATVPALVLTWYWREKHKREDLEIAQQGQVTERFTRAIEQLGHKEFAIRIGGIFALERIMQDSPRDHWTIVETLCAFARLQSPSGAASEGEPVHADLQAALTVIGRRNVDNDGEGNFVNLSKCHLANANLDSARLDRANLDGANISGANMARTHLEKAFLGGADMRCASLAESQMRCAELRGANLGDSILVQADLSGAVLKGSNLAGAAMWSARLSGTDLSGANLLRVDLSNADLSNADLSNADLTNAVFEGANLTGANLTGARLEGARMHGAILTNVIRPPHDLLEQVIVDYCTVLPEGFRRPKHAAPVKQANEEPEE